MKIAEFQDRLMELSEEFVEGMKEVTATELGIDPRASYRFYVSEDGIAVTKSHEGSCEYYAGFEYEREYKIDMGFYVFWSSDSARIQGHLARLPEFGEMFCEEECDE